MQSPLETLRKGQTVAPVPRCLENSCLCHKSNNRQTANISLDFNGRNSRIHLFKLIFWILLLTTPSHVGADYLDEEQGCFVPAVEPRQILSIGGLGDSRRLLRC